MRGLLCLFLINIWSYVNSGQSNNNWREIGYDDGNYGHQQLESVQRPCSLHDVSCIKQYFAQNSQCSPVQGLGLDALGIKSIPMSIPHVNITFTLHEVEVKGYHDFRVKEFYISKQTGRLVFEVEFRKLWVYSPFTVIVFHRRGRDPLELADYAVIEYKDLSMTLVAPQDKDINLSEAHVYTYISDTRPKQALGPNFTESKDPHVQLVIRRLIDNIGLSLQEAFVTKGPILMSAFLQNSICNY